MIFEPTEQKRLENTWNMTYSIKPGMGWTLRWVTWSSLMAEPQMYLFFENSYANIMWSKWSKQGSVTWLRTWRFPFASMFHCLHPPRTLLLAKVRTEVNLWNLELWSVHTLYISMLGWNQGWIVKYLNKFLAFAQRPRRGQNPMNFWF